MKETNGEELLLDDVGLMESEESILSCAVVIANQAHRILNSTEDWTALPQNDTSISVEKKSITGASLAHKTTTIPLIRSEGRIECSAAELYTLLISKEGYELLDSDADPDEFNKPFLGPFSFERTGSGPIAGKVQLEHATLKIPMLATRDYVVMNVHDSNSMTFSSGSILHSNFSGGSKYQAAMPMVSGWFQVRNAFAGAYSCEPIPGEDHACVLRIWQWVDLGGWVPDWLCHRANLRWFCPCYQRVRSYVANKM